MHKYRLQVLTHQIVQRNIEYVLRSKSYFKNVVEATYEVNKELRSCVVYVDCPDLKTLCLVQDAISVCARDANDSRIYIESCEEI